jgi:hypothetical protein
MKNIIRRALIALVIVGYRPKASAASQDILQILPTGDCVEIVPSIRDELINLVSPSFPKALKTLLSIDRLKIVMAIYNKSTPLSYRNLSDEAGINNESSLNHSLTELKNARLVILDDGKYYLTGLAITMIDTLIHAKKEMYKDPGKLYEPVIFDKNEEADIECELDS